MPFPVITSIVPAAGNQGDTLTLHGSNFGTSASVMFRGPGGRERVIDPVTAGPTVIRVIVPAFDGLPGTLDVVVITPAGESNAEPFALAAWPVIETVYPLCSLGMLKAMLGLSPDDTGEDARYQAMILAASATIDRECKSDFRQVVTTGELQDGDGTALLTLARRPIVSVQALSIAGQALDPAEVKVYPDWIRFEESDDAYHPRLRTGSRVFPRGNQNIRIDYTSGYSAVPAEIAEACVEQVVFIQNTLGKQGVESESNPVQSASATFSQVPIAPAARRKINRYRPQRVAVI